MNPVFSDFRSQSPNHSSNSGVPRTEKHMLTGRIRGDFSEEVALEPALKGVGFRHGLGRVYSRLQGYQDQQQEAGKHEAKLEDSRGGGERDCGKWKKL